MLGLICIANFNFHFQFSSFSIFEETWCPRLSLAKLPEYGGATRGEIVPSFVGVSKIAFLAEKIDF